MENQQQPENKSTGSANSDKQQKEHRILINSLPSNRGPAWLASAFKIYKASKATWFSIGSFLFIASLFPFLSTLIIIFMPLLVGGLMIGCSQSAKSNPMKFDYLFSGLKNHARPLLILSFINSIILIIVSMATFEISLAIGYDLNLLVPKNVESGKADEILAWLKTIDPVLFLETFLTGILIFLLLMVPVFMAFWYAPALVCLENLSATNALYLSFYASNKNKKAFFTYGLVAISYLLLFFLGLVIISSFMPILAIPVMLFCYILFFVVSLISLYTSFSETFTNSSTGKKEDELEDPDNNDSGSMIV